MILLALDLGTTTGWARCETESGLIVVGTQSFKPQRYEGGGMRYLRFQRWLTDLEADQIMFEEVRGHKGVDAAHIYGGLLAHLTAWCESRNIPYQGVPVGTIKKYWAGSGNAGKAIMIKIAQERGFTVKDDNEADALALLHWMLDHAITSPVVQRSSLHKPAKRRVQVEALELAPANRQRRTR